ncbi:ABC transporter substrate-binding protein [Nocardia sp. NBC_01377]|uniref:ABC transporter substrate-binding protein n=1 Tax=Nocardia sp. NBC_01377 TaxID=2903595 RepID=UPI0038663863
MRGRSGPATEAESDATESGSFGDLSSICHSGSTTSAATRGVTATEIKVGVFSDIGFTKQSEFVDAAKVFTAWCNAAGGINGRKIVSEVRDTNLMEVRQRMLDACREDFVLVGGGAALDGLGVKDRLSCLLPEFPAQVSQLQNLQSDLHITALAGTYAHYEPYFGFRTWLMHEAYPNSAEAIGVITGDSPVTKVLADKAIESIEAAAGTVTYSDLYPDSGVSDWTPYAQSIKNKGVRGLAFYGDFRQPAKLEDFLTSMDYKLDWIDPTNNSYNSQFLQAAAQSIKSQNNIIDLTGAVPIEAVETSPAMKQMHDVNSPAGVWSRQPVGRPIGAAADCIPPRSVQQRRSTTVLQRRPSNNNRVEASRFQTRSGPVPPATSPSTGTPAIKAHQPHWPTSARAPAISSNRPADIFRMICFLGRPSSDSSSVDSLRRPEPVGTPFTNRRYELCQSSTFGHART